MDTRKCEKECVECETACPLSLIKISKVGFDGNPSPKRANALPNEKKRVQVTLTSKKSIAQPAEYANSNAAPGALKVKKAFEGKITINQEKCPEGCTDCLDVCPITGALSLGEDKKVHVNELFCTYCGACKNVCPVPEALSVKRTKVHHTPIHSGTWNKALERITQPNRCC